MIWRRPKPKEEPVIIEAKPTNDGPKLIFKTCKVCQEVYEIGKVHICFDPELLFIPGGQ